MIGPLCLQVVDQFRVAERVGNPGGVLDKTK